MKRPNMWETYSEEQMNAVNQLCERYKTCLDIGKTERECVTLAIKMAEERDLDLVEVAPNANPVVCKIMNYGKYKYEQARKEKESKKKQKIVEVKEIRLSSTIDTHDFEFKSKNARKFLEDGNKVKATIKFKGRELNNTTFGSNVLKKFAEALDEVGMVDKEPLYNTAQTPTRRIKEVEAPSATVIDEDDNDDEDNEFELPPFLRNRNY